MIRTLTGTIVAAALLAGAATPAGAFPRLGLRLRIPLGSNPPAHQRFPLALARMPGGSMIGAAAAQRNRFFLQAIRTPVQTPAGGPPVEEPPPGDGW
jgi:hypothetical protein